MRSIVKSVSRLTTTSYAILGQLAQRPRTSYELTKQMARNLRFFWPRAESRIYAQVKALLADGLVSAERSYTGRRARTTYSVTTKGRRALAAWLASAPGGGFELESEALVRLFMAGFGTPEQLLAAIERMEGDAWAVLVAGSIVGPEYLAGTAEYQDQVHLRALLFDFLSSHAMVILDWAERTRRTVQRWDETQANNKTRAALRTIATRLKTFPVDVRNPPQA